MDFKESGFMYALGGFIVVFVLAQSLFFLIRAWKQGKKLGLSTATMRGTVTQSALFSLAPAISIVATILTLSGALGIVLPWIRLTVIGAISYEVPAAESAMDHGSPGLFYRRVGDDSGLCDAACDHSLCHEENSKQYRQGGKQEYCLGGCNERRGVYRSDQCLCGPCYCGLGRQGSVRRRRRDHEHYRFGSVYAVYATVYAD